MPGYKVLGRSLRSPTRLAAGPRRTLPAAPPPGHSIATYTCQAYTLGSVKAAGTVAPKTAQSLTRCILSRPWILFHTVV